MPLRLARLSGSTSTPTATLRLAKLSGSTSGSLAGALRLASLSGTISGTLGGVLTAPTQIGRSADVITVTLDEADLAIAATWRTVSGPACTITPTSNVTADVTLPIVGADSTVTIGAKQGAAPEATLVLTVQRTRLKFGAIPMIRWFGTLRQVDQSSIINRDALVPMVDKPTRWTVGPTVDTFIDVYPATGATTISVSGNQTGRRYWGTVTASNGTVFRDCVFGGADPDKLTTALSGCVQNFGTKKIQLWDCLIDPSIWLTAAAPDGARARLNGYTIGIWGHNFEMHRCESRNVHDLYNIAGPTTSQADSDNAWFLISLCWAHRSYYINNTIPPNDGQPHGDIFQIANVGRGRIEGSILGGVRVPSDYLVWPQETTPGSTVQGGHDVNRAGDDAVGAIFMLKQETAGTPAYIRDLTIIGNWIYGGGYGINIASDGQPQTWAGLSIINNRFGQRQSGWNKLKQFVTRAAPEGPQPGDPVEVTANDNGAYIIRNPSNFTGLISGNIIEETGAPVPITNGA